MLIRNSEQHLSLATAIPELNYLNREVMLLRWASSSIQDFNSLWMRLCCYYGLVSQGSVHKNSHSGHWD